MLRTRTITPVLSIKRKVTHAICVERTAYKVLPALDEKEISANPFSSQFIKSIAGQLAMLCHGS